MKKFISFLAYALLAGAVTFTFSACGDKDDDEKEQKFETQTVTVGGVSFKIVAVEGGTFQMGAPFSDTDAFEFEKPQHYVTLSNYYIGETEVTQALWQAVMGSNPSNWKGEKLPVEMVSWNDCQGFINKLNEMTGKKFRLPTEAEWEYAASGGKYSQGYKFAGGNDLDAVAWNTNNSDNKTHQVATKAANEIGLYDMSGNVWEWCQDWYGSYGSEIVTNPQGNPSGYARVYRGGSWGYGERYCRSKMRNSYNPSTNNHGLGFRLAMGV